MSLSKEIDKQVSSYKYPVSILNDVNSRIQSHLSSLASTGESLDDENDGYLKLQLRYLKNLVKYGLVEKS